MSVQAITRVLEHSTARGTARLVLLVIANHETEGRGAHPSVDRLAHEAGLSVRAVQEAIRRLEAAGELRVERNAGPGRTNVYVTLPGRVQNLHPADSRREPAPRTKGTSTTTPLSSETSSPQTSPQHEPAGFAEFWQTYPRRVGRRKALEAFRRALQRARLEEILDGARRYRDDPHREPEFTAHPTTWLNRDGWEDDPLPPRRAGPGPPLHPVDQAVEVARRMREAKEAERGGGSGVGAGRPALRGLPRP